MAVSVCYGACTDLTATDPISAEMEASTEWPPAVLVTDVRTVEVMLSIDGEPASGVELDVASSPPGVLTVRQLFDADATPTNRLELTAIGTGATEITVSLPAAFAPDTLRVAMRVHMKWSDISAGYEHSCGLTFTGAAYCWGGGRRFLGDGSSNSSNVPSAVVGAFTFGAIDAGWGHTCGTLSGGLVLCWGFNQTGALGTGNQDDQLAPVTARFGATLRSFVAGHQYTCGISGTLTAVCWGDDTFGQLGSARAVDVCGADPCSLSPVVVQSPAQLAGDTVPRFSYISAGDRTSCAVAAEHAVVSCWGSNTHGILGTLAVASSDTAMVISGGFAFGEVSVGRYHACGITGGGGVVCWGTNRFGELGVESVPEICGGRPCTTVPVTVAGAPAVAAISVHENYTCALGTDGYAYCWGLNDAGQLGSETSARCSGLSCSRAPVRVDAEERFRVLSTGRRHACGVTVEGGAFCWGEGVEGKLGTGSAVDRGVPTRVLDPG